MYHRSRNELHQGETMLSYLRRLFGRRKPANNLPELTKIAIEGNTAIFLRGDGSMYRKQYDEDGRGCGSRPADRATIERMRPIVEALQREQR